MSKFVYGSIVRVLPDALDVDVDPADFAFPLRVIGWRVSPFTGRCEAEVSIIGGADSLQVVGWVAECDLEEVLDDESAGDTAEDQFTGNDLGAEMAAAEAGVVVPPGFVVNDDGVLVQIGRE